MTKLRLYLLALLALCAASFAAPAAATTCNSYVVPTDVAAQAGWTCSTITPTWDTTNSAQNVAIDPAVTAPTQTGLTNIPVPSQTNRTIASTGDINNFTTLIPDGGTGQQAKFRTHSDFCDYKPDDPIRNFGTHGVSHLHTFFGNCSANGDSTNKSLRNHALLSASAGTDVNGTAYWFPTLVEVNRDGDGKNYAVKLNYVILYYEKDASTTALENEAKTQTLIPNGLRYVFGYNMDDGATSNNGGGAWLQTLIDAANTANQAAGYAGNRYQMTHGGGDWKGGAYYCLGGTPDATVSTGVGSKYLQRPDGGDPWNGTCEYGKSTSASINSSGVLTVGGTVTGTFQASQFLHYTGQYNTGAGPTIVSQISGTTGGAGTYQTSCSSSCTVVSTQTIEGMHDFFVDIGGPDCWDGKNLWSPGGYKHVIPRIYDNKYGKLVCPNNFYIIPSLVLELHHSYYGWADGQKMSLSSDAGRRTALGGTTSQYPNGFSFHTDWMDGWDHVQMDKWQKNCLGALHTQPHQCASSQIDSTTRLYGGVTEPGAGGRSPQVDTTTLKRIVAGDSGWGTIPSSWTSSITGGHIHASADPFMLAPAQKQEMAEIVPVEFDLAHYGH